MIHPSLLHSSWHPYLSGEFDKSYMQQLKMFLANEKESNSVIYPSSENIFAAFNETTFEKVRVVILGQDPYHGEENNTPQAHGLSFSVPAGVKPPPSLLNIYKELHTDLNLSISSSGNLNAWAEQGVFLLNSVLTVRAHEAASHRNQGWEQFTDQAIQALNEHHDNLVFLLWGSYAQKKAAFVDTSKHLVLTSPHPSPLSAYRGFFGCQHFSKTNTYLTNKKKPAIRWSLD